LCSLQLRPELGLEAAAQRSQIKLGKQACAFATAERKHQMVDGTVLGKQAIECRAVGRIHAQASHRALDILERGFELSGVASDGEDSGALAREPSHQFEADSRGSADDRN
jgi:hypothetical protein